MLKWEERFATGSAVLDTQHRMLFDKINQIEELLNGPPPSSEACEELLDFLGTYADTHFKYEEQCMERARCPVHAQNQQAHAAFRAMFAKFMERYLKEGPRPELLRSVQSAASDWLTNPIVSVDVHLKSCLQK